VLWQETHEKLANAIMQLNIDVSQVHIKIEKHLEYSADGCKNATLDISHSMH